MHDVCMYVRALQRDQHLFVSDFGYRIPDIGYGWPRLVGWIKI